TRRHGVCAGMIITAVATSSIVAPWLVFNAQRGVIGFTGNVGFQLNSHANDLGVGTPVNTESVLPYTAEWDRELVHLALRRFASAPAAYLRAVVKTMAALFVPVRVVGDVAPFIRWCQTAPHVTDIAAKWPPPAAFHVSWGHLLSPWRCRLHRKLMLPFAVLTTAGWIGVGAWIMTSLFRGRLDMALLASSPVACLVALCPMIQANTRFAFPCEALALGFGLPAGSAVAIQCIPAWACR